MYLIAGVFALVVTAGIHTMDSFFARSWFDSDIVRPLAYTPLTVACVAASVSFLLAAPITLRWPRIAVVLVGVGWLVGIAAPRLLPWWQRTHGVDAFGGWDVFTAVWLVVLVPLCVAAVYGIVLDRRSVNGASA